MPNVTKPPILDGTGQTIKQKLSEILAALQGGGSYIPTSQKGAANGVAELDSGGKVPSSQLPSYVDDVLEYASVSNFPATGENGKIYIALDTNLTYRWSGSAYVEISPSLALGETSSTAYRGDRGKTAYDHSQSDHSTIAPAFSEAGTRTNIASGENFATLLGKIKKFFSDLKTVAFTGSYTDLTDKPNRAASSSDGGEATTVKITARDNESSTWYYPPFQNASTTSSAGRDLYTNNGLRYKTMLGTTETDGEATISIGNATASGTAGNKTGYLRVYGSGTGYGAISFGGTNNSKAYTLPNKNGTFALTDDLSAYVAKSGDTMTGRLTMGGKPISQVVTGSGTVGQDKGSGQTNRYVPSEWVFNTGVTVADGDIFTIKIPVAGISYGVWVSMDNGTTYYPVAINGTSRLSTQYGVDSYLTLQYENAGSVKVYDRGGSDSSSTVTQIFRVLNYSPDSTKLPLAGGTMTGTINSQHVIPKSNNAYDLGSSSYRFNEAYVQDTVHVGKDNTTTGKVSFYHGSYASSQIDLTTSGKLPSGTTNIYLPSQGGTLALTAGVVKTVTKDVTWGNVTTTFTFTLYYNGIKKMQVASGTTPAAGNNTATGVIPADYRPVENVYFSGVNTNYTSTSNVERGRYGCLLADGSIYVYGSNAAGLYASVYYM